MPERRKPLWRVAFGTAVLCAGLLVAAAVWRSTVGRNGEEHIRFLVEPEIQPKIDRDLESRIAAFCGDCHSLPPPERFPRDAWHREVQRGYEFYADSGRNDLAPPPMQATVAYYRSRAPERIEFPEPSEASHKLPVTFSVKHFRFAPETRVAPAVAHLRWTCLQTGESPALLACDLRRGTVVAVDVQDPAKPPHILASLNQPCHIEPCDLDGDQAIDLVVADLGSSYPADHDRGQVIWLRRDRSSGSYQKQIVASGLGRVADVQPIDVDRDGDQDLLVAEFGMYRTGSILLLRNVAPQGTTPQFERQELDPRPGVIHLPVHDFNGDDRADFVALVSQEHESVDLFLNQGRGQFVPHNLWTAPDLTFGSSGLNLVDLDRDGDLDILYTNGDSFDNSYVMPHHGVQWIENLSDLRFAYHRLADLLGAYRAVAGDVDRDGDLDIMAVAWLPRQCLPPEVAKKTLASVVCLEQVAPGEFVRHTLERDSPYYATCELADFDGDGDLDFAVGSFLANVGQLPHWLAVWWNQGTSPPRDGT